MKCWQLTTVFLIACLAMGSSAYAQMAKPDPQKGVLLYENPLADKQSMDDWVMEGPAVTEFRDGWMHMFSPEKKGHHVFWCPEDFPDSFIAEWELQNMEPDAGLCIVFFSATGIHGEDVFDPSLKERDGVFSKYTKSDLNNYHISYYANGKDNPGRQISHLRKNAGFNLVHYGQDGIPVHSTDIHKMRLIKQENRIMMYADDRRIIDWTDDGKEHGPALGGGKIALRQMQWTHFRYRNFRVWELREQPAIPWPRHTIDASSGGADGVKMGDINRDGRLDIATGWEEGGITKVYFHPGAANVKKLWPAVQVGETPNVEDAVFVDMNADGQPDVVSCSEKGTEKIFVHLAPKKNWQRSKKWKQEGLPASKGLMMWMYAEPLQVDGIHGTDLLAAGKGKNAQLGWFAAPASAAALDQWTWHPITPVGWIMSLMLRDMDADGDQDLMITDRYGEHQGCRWLENPGPGEAQQQAWNSHLVGGKGLEVMFMTMADLDGDGLEEAVVAERTGQSIRIYHRLDPQGRKWREQIVPLPTSAGMAKSVEAGDIDQDGTQDLVISTNTNGAEKYGLIWLSGKKLQAVKTADFQPISAPHNAKYDRVELMDLDGDGDLDILICEENFGDQSQGLGVIWYENPSK